MREYLKEFSEYLSDVKKSSANTIESYVRDVRAFLSYAEINSVDISSASSDEIKQYIGYLERIGKNP